MSEVKTGLEDFYLASFEFCGSIKYIVTERPSSWRQRRKDSVVEKPFEGGEGECSLSLGES